MVSSKATTVEEYLAELPDDRRRVVAEVRKVVRNNLPAGYVERMNWGMISYEIPLETYPDTHNKQPLSYIALAAQKHHYALYLHGVYMSPEKQEALRQGFAAAGKKMDMGKSCVRFKKLEDLPLDVVADSVSATSVEEYIANYESVKRR